MKNWDLSKVTPELLDPYTGEAFRLRYDEIELEVVLESIKLYPVRTPNPTGNVNVGIRLQSFSLLFRGPAEPEVGQGLATIEHLELGSLGPVLVVWVGQNETGRKYSVDFG